MTFALKTRRTIALATPGTAGALGPTAAHAKVISSTANGFLIENSAVVPVDATIGVEGADR